MDVGLDIGTTSARSQVGHVIVYNHVHSRDIDTPSNDVGSNENLGLTVSEAVEDSITFLGELVTVERGNGMAFGNKTLGDMVGGDFSLQSTSSQGTTAQTMRYKNSGLTLQKTILCPMTKQSYRADKASYFWSSLSHSR